MEEIKITMNDLYHIRLICFIENQPQSNKYHQIVFSKEQFSKLSGFINDLFPKEENHNCGNPSCKGTIVEISDELVELPDEVQDAYEEEKHE